MTENSTDPKDLNKLREIIDDIDIAMVTTHDAGDAARLISRPLSTQVAESDGDVLFLTERSSSFVRDIAADPQVNVAYAGKGAWVSLSGRAQLVEDRALVEKLWSTGSSLFLEGGPENPENVVVRVEGDTAELWGGQSKVATAVKMVRAMTGNRDDDGTTVIDLP